MQPEEVIPADEFCIHHNIEVSFIYSLHESGLIEIIKQEEKIFLQLSQVGQLEKMVRLHYEMGINREGIETITYLLERMNEMQRRIIYLTNRLSMYENE
jgi:MerR HTH family regulatory protein